MNEDQWMALQIPKEDDFDNKKISIAESHVAKNVAAALVRIISDKQNKND